jgi:hypothetical protein
MPRPTPARIFYMLIGIILGIVLFVVGQYYLIPGLVQSLVHEMPFLASSPTPVAAAGPTQFTGSNLERVQMLNLVQDKNGAQIRLNSLEYYRDGFAITYSVTSGRGASPQTLEPEMFTVQDARGTPYTSSPLGSAAAVSAGFTSGVVSFTPTPPADVRELRVSVPNAISLGLRPREAQSRVIAGPWEFQVPLQR